ncbi:hypothetical protein P9112_000703 [Eukaryota sp. TZLM1-RC]
MQLPFVILLLAALVSAGCNCPGRCGNGYRGTQAQCYCYCSEQATKLQLPSDATCSFFPYIVGRSTGGCSLCSSAIMSTEEDLRDNHVAQPATSIVTSNREIVFPLPFSKCYVHNCGAFIGTKGRCFNWAKEYGQQFLNQDYRISFMPHTTRSKGICTVSGHVHPCNPPS